MEICDFCGCGELVLVEENLPFVADYYICIVCNNTYAVEYTIEEELENSPGSSVE